MSRLPCIVAADDTEPVDWYSKSSSDTEEEDGEEDDEEEYEDDDDDGHDDYSNSPPTISLSALLEKEAEKLVSNELSRRRNTGLCNAYKLHSAYRTLCRRQGDRPIAERDVTSIRKMCQSLLRTGTTVWDRCRIEAVLFPADWRGVVR